MAIVPYELTPEDGLRMIGALPTPGPPGPHEITADDVPAPTDPRPWLGTHNVVQELITVGCFTCEQPLTKDNAHSDCPGEPGQKLAYVDEHGRDLHPNEVIDDTTIPSNVRFTAVRRNQPCPCGSGRKYKHCHGGPR